MVTLSLEEPALAPARALMRVPYWEHLLELVHRGCVEADFSRQVSRAHADLATYLATILVGLFEPERLALLPNAIVDFRCPGRCLPRSTTSSGLQPTCPPTPTLLLVEFSASSPT